MMNHQSPGNEPEACGSDHPVRRLNFARRLPEVASRLDPDLNRRKPQPRFGHGSWMFRTALLLILLT